MFEKEKLLLRQSLRSLLFFAATVLIGSRIALSQQDDPCGAESLLQDALQLELIPGIKLSFRLASKSDRLI
jgi:hypothetical protein